MSDETVRRTADEGEEFGPEDVAAASCPVGALGQRDGRYFFVAASGEIRVLAAREMSPQGILSIFDGRPDWLVKNCPRLDRDGKPTGDWGARGAAGLLIRMCADAGLWDEETPVHGRGVWRDKAGRLLVHVGDRLYIERGQVRAGRRFEGAIYPAQPPLEAPDYRNPATATEARKAFELLGLWRFRAAGGRRLVFGWIAAALLGAAPRWRAHFLVHGAAGCGKSALLDFLRALGGDKIRYSNNFSEAGVRQMISGEARPLLLDEAEDKSRDSVMAKVVELIRQMSSGTGMAGVRGSAEGAARGFGAAAAVLIAGINPPMLLPQDRARITEGELVPPDPENAERLPEALDFVGALAPRFFARAIAGWARFPDNLAVFRQALLETACDGRQADQWGTLLAGAETLLEDRVIDSDSAAALVDELAPLLRTLRDEQSEESDARQCLRAILTSHVDHWKGGARSTLGAMLIRGMETNEIETRLALRTYGLRLELSAPEHPDLAGITAPYLVVANGHEGLSALMRSTRWPSGAWSRALRRLDGALPTPRAVRFDGAQMRGTVIGAEHLPEPTGGVDDGGDDASPRHPSPGEGPPP